MIALQLESQKQYYLDEIKRIQHEFSEMSQEKYNLSDKISEEVSLLREKEKVQAGFVRESEIERNQILVCILKFLSDEIQTEIQKVINLIESQNQEISKLRQVKERLGSGKEEINFNKKLQLQKLREEVEEITVQVSWVHS